MLNKNDIVEYFIESQVLNIYNIGLSWEEKIEYCVKRAYRDLARVLSGIEKYSTQKEKAINTLMNKLQKYFKDKPPINSQTDFDGWHKGVCDELIECFGNATISRKEEPTKEKMITYGVAQKWVNMSFKYLYIVSAPSLENHFKYCHMALDSFTLKWCKDKWQNDEEKLNLIKSLCVNTKSTVWSKINNYDKYLELQKEARKLAQKEYEDTLFKSEFVIWQDMVNKG